MKNQRSKLFTTCKNPVNLILGFLNDDNKYESIFNISSRCPLFGKLKQQNNFPPPIILLDTFFLINSETISKKLKKQKNNILEIIDSHSVAM